MNSLKNKYLEKVYFWTSVLLLLGQVSISVIEVFKLRRTEFKIIEDHNSFVAIEITGNLGLITKNTYKRILYDDSKSSVKKHEFQKAILNPDLPFRNQYRSNPSIRNKYSNSFLFIHSSTSPRSPPGNPQLV